MGVALAICSGKGGVGKTNILVNIGVALAEAGRSVALIDGSLTTPDVSLHLGIPFHVRGLSHILKEKAPLESATFHHKSGLKVIPGNVHLNVLKEFEGKEFSKLLTQLKKEHELVLLDCAAGLGRETLSALQHCDKTLIVANPELPSVVDASKAIQIAKSLKVKPVGIIINRVGRFRQELSVEEIMPLLHKIPLLGLIPENRKIPRTIKKSEAIVSYYPRHSISQEFRRIAFSLVPKRKGKLPPAPPKGFFDFFRR